MRLSDIHDKLSSEEEEIPFRRLVFWAAVAAAIVLGVILYFKYGRLIVPLAAQ